MDLPQFEGWHLLGAFPDGVADDVGSWLLHHGGEALLLEVPPGLTPEHVRAALSRVGAELRYATASHVHEDHLDRAGWRALRRAFPAARFLWPPGVAADLLLDIGGEPAWLLKAAKHSPSDLIAVFRGVAMTGDVELGTLASVNREVPGKTKRASMARLRDFPARTGYRVHAVVSAHLNDVRTGIDWPALFDC